MKYLLVISAIILSFLLNEETNDQQKLTYARVWGLVNYFHYPVIDGKQDWNQTLINELDKENFNWSVNDLLKHVKVPEQKNWESYYDKTAANHFLDFIPVHETGFHTLDFSWLKDNEFLNEESRKKIGSIFSRYVGGKHVKCKKSPFSYRDFSFRNKIQNPNEYILGFIHTWCFFDYRNPYKNLLDHKWEEVFTDNIKFAEIGTQESYKTALTKISVGLQDDHSKLYDINKPTGQKVMPPFNFRIIESKLVITDKLGYDSPFKTGDIIRKINNYTAEQIISSGYNNVSLSKKENLETDIVFHFLDIAFDTTSSITVQRNDEIHQIKCNNVFT